MAIAWRDGANNSSGGSEASSLTVTIPSDVAAGDIVIIFFQVSAGSTPTASVSSTGTSPSQTGSTASYVLGGFTNIGEVYWFEASSTDASKIITITPSVNAYMGVSLGAWSGCSSSQPDVISSPGTESTESESFTAPTAVTNTNGDWAVYVAGTASGAIIDRTGPGTQREVDNEGRSGIFDSNGSVGNSGTTIGGGTWTNGQNAGWLGFTLGLKPPTGTPHTDTASLTVTPSFTADVSRGQYRTASLTVAPSFLAKTAVAHVRTASLTVHPSFLAIPFGGAHPASAGAPGDDEAREFKRWLLWDL